MKKIHTGLRVLAFCAASLTMGMSTHVAYADGTKVGSWNWGASGTATDGTTNWFSLGHSSGPAPDYKGANGTRSWSGTNTSFTGQGGWFSASWNSAGGNWIPDISRGGGASGALNTMAQNYNIQWDGSGDINPNGSSYVFGLKFNLAAPKADGTNPGWPGYYDMTSSYECYIVTHSNKTVAQRDGRFFGTVYPPGDPVGYDCYEFTTNWGHPTFKQLYAWRRQNSWSGPVNVQAIVKYWSDNSGTSLNYNTWYMNTGISIMPEAFSTAGWFRADNIKIPDLNTALPMPTTGSGLRGEYYSGTNFTTLVKSQTDATVNFNWGNGSPTNPDGTAMGGIHSDNFSVRWTGQIQALEGGNYTFTTTSDDGVRLWVNGALLINKWVDQGPTSWSGTISLAAGQKYDIKMEYYENGGGATAKLFWTRPGGSSVIVPQSQLYPLAATPPSSNDVMYSFNDVSHNALVNGTHGGINFGNGQWGAGDYFGFVGGWFWDNTSHNRSFTLPSGTRLKSIKLSTGFAGSTWSISDGVNPTRSGTFASVDTPITVNTNWTNPGTNVTITFGATWDSGIDDIVYGQ